MLIRRFSNIKRVNFNKSIERILNAKPGKTSRNRKDSDRYNILGFFKIDNLVSKTKLLGTNSLNMLPISKQHKLLLISDVSD